jgi:hypothetical protein
MVRRSAICTRAPYRIGALDAAFGYFRTHPDVWFAAGSEIVQHYRQVVSEG